MDREHLRKGCLPFFQATLKQIHMPARYSNNIGYFLKLWLKKIKKDCWVDQLMKVIEAITLHLVGHM